MKILGMSRIIVTYTIYPIKFENKIYWALTRN